MFKSEKSRIFFICSRVFVLLLVCSPAVLRSGEPAKALVLSSRAVQLKVPFEEQGTPRECGLAVANMLCGYYGQKLNETLRGRLKDLARSADGITGAELLAVLRAADHEAAVFPGTLDDKGAVEDKKTGLYYHLNKGRPLIVMITSKDGKNSHYDVLTGYDPQRSLLLLLDPATGPVTVSTKDFLPAWKRANHFTLLAVPKKTVEDEKEKNAH